MKFKSRKKFHTCQADGELCSPSARLCRFFCEYASVMLGCGATCLRITKNLNRMAAAVDGRVDLVILPSHVLVALTRADGNECVQYEAPIAKLPIDFAINTRLSNLSWKVAEKRITVDRAAEMFWRIVDSGRMSPLWVWLLVVAANMSFCRIFGGDWGAVALVGIATLAGFRLKTWLMGRGMDAKPVFALSAFVAALISIIGYFVAGLTATPNVALATSVLFLIPGIPYINAVSDMLAGHYLCAFSRFMNALLLTACIAAGMACAILLLRVDMFQPV
ncbi:MAG: threonine/serine exporter family protein [Muribaculaceae bacterium]|nr:threonine/serine exporter family protein [Muribaculaceae bacterium]